MEILSGIFVHLLDLTRRSCKKCNYRPSGKNRTCGPAITVQHSNQLSYRVQLSSSNHKYILLSISGNFSTRCSQIRCELANYVGRELRNEVRKLISKFEL